MYIHGHHKSWKVVFTPVIVHISSSIYVDVMYVLHQPCACIGKFSTNNVQYDLYIHKTRTQTNHKHAHTSTIYLYTTNHKHVCTPPARYITNNKHLHHPP
jgi:hypothetical protein